LWIINLFRNNWYKIKSLFLRISALAAKFVLIVYLSKYKAPTVLGEFSIFSTTLLLCVFIVGLDYYSYSLRAIIKSNETIQKFNLITSQFSFYLFSYALTSILLFTIFFFILFYQKNTSFIFFLFFFLNIYLKRYIDYLMHYL
jgi:hypothetical protein